MQSQCAILQRRRLQVAVAVDSGWKSRSGCAATACAAAVGLVPFGLEEQKPDIEQALTASGQQNVDTPLRHLARRRAVARAGAIVTFQVPSLRT